MTADQCAKSGGAMTSAIGGILLMWYIIFLIIGTGVLYIVIRTAVRDGIEEAWKRRAEHIPSTPPPHPPGGDENKLRP